MITKEVIMEFHKRFAAGEQFIQLNGLGEIEDIFADYYWQSREVFNFLQVYVDRYANKLSEEALYGENGLVFRLIPFQRAYNNIKNRELEYINRLTFGVCAVEDGSVDLDALQDEGLYPGKVLVYRQGSQAPSITDSHVDTFGYLNSANDILAKMDEVAEAFYNSHAGEYKKEG